MLLFWMAIGSYGCRDLAIPGLTFVPWTVYITGSIQYQHQNSSLHVEGVQSHCVQSYTFCFWNPWTHFLFFLYKFFYVGEKEVLLIDPKLTHSKIPSIFIFVRFLSFFFLNSIWILFPSLALMKEPVLTKRMGDHVANLWLDIRIIVW